jgi:hypothetical protein
MMTLFEYLYRDAGNFKAYGSVAFQGALSEEGLQRVSRLLDGDGMFIAEQLGVPPLYEHLYVWSNGSTRSDHCWHEFLRIRVIEDREVPPKAKHSGSAEQFLKRLAGVKRWEEERSPHFSADPRA